MMDRHVTSRALQDFADHEEDYYTATAPAMPQNRLRLDFYLRQYADPSGILFETFNRRLEF